MIEKCKVKYAIKQIIFEIYYDICIFASCNKQNKNKTHIILEIVT